MVGWEDTDSAKSIALPAMALLSMTTNPTATETVTIGADVYEWDGAGANINVAIGVDHDASHAALTAAINTCGTENVIADYDQFVTTGTTRIQPADTPGGNVLYGPGPSIVLSETMAHVNAVWNCDNLNLTGWEATPRMIGGKLTINTSMEAFPNFMIRVPFKVTHIIWTAHASTDAKKVTTAVVEPTLPGLTGHISFEFKAGATPLGNTDYILWQAFGFE